VARLRKRELLALRLLLELKLLAALPLCVTPEPAARLRLMVELVVVVLVC